jgi:hypothetical protein
MSVIPIAVAHDATCPKGQEWLFHHFPKGGGSAADPEDTGLGCIVASLLMLVLVIVLAVCIAVNVRKEDNSKEDAKMSEQQSQDLAVPVPAGKVKCSMCQNVFDDEPIKTRDSDLCPECRKKYGGMAFVYCNKCRAIVTRIPPGLQMGMLIKPYDVVHVRECPACSPGIVKSIPVEVEALRDEKSRRP